MMMKAAFDIESHHVGMWSLAFDLHLILVLQCSVHCAPSLRPHGL